ncbi:unnamed protein product, partial [Mesorhabditis belari]|uniref:Uncharacterized protein n=1 Tax=Mesorhabditis belari TaxID=2138241 RepID=A0AAF3EQU4_9BILA
MEKIQTQWPKITVAGAIWFLSAVEDNMIGVSEWPYMHTIDPKATTSFFGVASAMSHAGHAIFAMLFAFWSYRWRTTRWPLLAGRLISLLGCILYLGVEILNENRRILMLVCYFLFGCGLGSMAVVRTYVAEVSSESDRSRAYAVTTASNLLAITLGPMIQLAFSAKTFEYPGHEIIKGKIRFHFYTAPIWFALGMNVIAIILLIFFFKDVKKERQNTIGSHEPILKRLFSILQRSGIVWPLVFLCLFQIIASKITQVTISTVVAPLFMAGYGWTGHKSVIIMSIGQAIVGVICILIAALFIFARLGQRIHPRVTFLFGMAITVLLYVLTYPWPKISVKAAAFNETTGIGCDPTQYGWCESHSTTPYIWIPLLILVMGLGLPLLMISLDTIYSKVLGNCDQNTMQGLNVLVEDLTLIVGSICSSAIFTKSGQKYLWIINGAFTFIGTALWLISFKRLAPFK